MMRVAVAFALLLGAATGASAAPKLVIERPTADFGTAEQGAVVSHVFDLANRGDSALHVEHVKSSCGCTVAVTSAREVPPGGTARVLVDFDTARVAGRTTKVFSVYTDDPTVPVAALTLTGEVLADLVLAPSPVYLGRVRRGERVQREVAIRPGRPGGTAAVQRVEGASNGLRARLEPGATGGQRLVVELAPDVALGRFHEELRLVTVGARQATLALPVFGSVDGDLLVLPPQVSFGVAARGAAPERSVFIRNRGRMPVSVRSVSVPDSVDYDLRVLEEGVEYQLSLRLREGLRPGEVKGEVEIFTDHPIEHRLVVPLYAVIRGRG